MPLCCGHFSNQGQPLRGRIAERDTLLGALVSEVRGGEGAREGLSSPHIRCDAQPGIMNSVSARLVGKKERSGSGGKFKSRCEQPLRRATAKAT